MIVINLPRESENSREITLRSIANTFFDKFGLEHCDEQIWELVQCYVSQPDGVLPKERFRASTIYFLHQVLELLRDLSQVSGQEVSESEQLDRA
jgi:hypothetical protein